MDKVEIRTEETPNPNAQRFVLNRAVQESARGRFFTEAGGAEEPLARALLDLNGVIGVMLLPNSVTVNKEPSALWDEVGPHAEEVIRTHFA